ncbi:MAG: PD-(D/E)XK nuclease family protein [Patescibacteria group bacterium]
MPPDKYSATWVSHSSISDFLRCPRAYYLKNVYRDPKNNHKIKLMTPSLALGQIAHEVLESLSVLPREKRLQDSLVTKFNEAWKNVSGKKGGFPNEEVEYRYRMRGEEMMRRVMNHPGPITELSVKINMDLPYFWLDEEENIILCGKIDWLKYLPEIDSVQIIDFKTGKREEDAGSLQLPIYNLLVQNCQKRKVSNAGYWYLGFSDVLTDKILPDLEEGRARVLDVARQIKMARQIERFKCPNGDAGCPDCRSFEIIARGEAELVGVDSYNADVYILPIAVDDEDREGSIL